MLLTFNKLPFVIKIFVLSIFEWPFYTGFIVRINSAYIDRLSWSHFFLIRIIPSENDQVELVCLISYI